MEAVSNNDKPLFTAVSSSVRQLFQLLRCVNFVSKAHVYITREGLRFTVEESHVMQAVVVLDKTLFTSYTYTPSSNAEDDGEDEDFETRPFQISLTSLLETLQILGINDTKERWPNREDVNSAYMRGDPTAVFEKRVLGSNGICRLTYASMGDPFCIILEEKGIITACELVTYEPEDLGEIPLQKDAIAQKIIMRASWLNDAINELSSTSPMRLTIVSGPTAPFFTLSSSGPLGSATVEFNKHPQLLETFQVPRRTVNTYKYSLIKGASKAMAIATKVSIRTDEQGVLSLQFMIEVDNGAFSFVDFRFVPFLPEEGEGEENDEMNYEPAS